MRSEETALRHLRTLGITGDTCEAEIRRAHRSAAVRHHPDRAPRGRVEESLERMKHVNAARDWLLENPWSWERPQAQTATEVPRNAVSGERPSGDQGEMAATRNGADARITLGGTIVMAVAIYLAVLAFAVVGWVITTLLGT